MACRALEISMLVCCLGLCSLAQIPDGYWVIRAICLKPPPVTNAFFTLTGKDYRREVTYQCQAGFQLVGDAKRFCPFYPSPNLWSGAAPSCLSVSTCGSNPCQNGATCEDLVEEYWCHCPPGWSGHTCEMDVSTCRSNPCQNGATCEDLVGEYRCHCTPGWSGPTCETAVSTCLSNPCQNGATCEDLVGEYRCHCPPGWSGNTCEMVVSTCLSNPCQNGATCEDLVGEFRCHCTPGWSGHTCDMVVSTCRSNPCQNGATCEDLVGEFRCHCTPGWSGHTCEMDIQPPVVNDCPGDVTKFISLKTVNVTWKKPTFSDPYGFDVVVESNYAREWQEFPWGRFSVQYSAVKPSNGLRETCVFNISVLPHPCPELPAPRRGVLVCNGWQRELGRFCLASCLRDLFLPLGHSPASWHVCGATGHWSRDFPPNLECKDKTQTAMRTLLPQPSSCDDTAGLGELASAYIDIFKASNFSSFCSDFADDCKPQNVDVVCVA